MEAPPAVVQTIGTLEELGPALTRCFRAPAGSAGSQVTIRFSLNSSGAVFGKPRVTYSHLVGTPADQQTFVAAAVEALQTRTPVAVTPALGRAIAGRPLSVRFIGGGRATST